METEREARERERQLKINKAVDELGDSINDTLIRCKHIEKAFLGMHPYHLNQVGNGILKAVLEREGDGRISERLLEAAKTVWGK